MQDMNMPNCLIKSSNRVGYDIFWKYFLHLQSKERVLSSKNIAQEVVIKKEKPSESGDAGTNMDYI
ncbi:MULTISPECIES: hypothetical protein [Klebsiella]|uniref:Uncharacterized protein n=1 Tax=Klebsiella michiganensis TaxID=1134687 RepID=A0ABR5GGP5_9ENTR|nr:hypothetical protein [Klebsiella michiganensis]AKL35923.1 hypothetical protein AB185_19380 [Klebsiella oxytoca]ARB20630.1 hypothetical protein AM394_05045 [Klebsiella oxytoca]AUW09718.1 hypothetical protein C2U42_10900 [Klebsiella oxytoca]EWF67508.1 hypothetical protein L387_03061 [Klebsiella michiganensis]KLY37484.1 hypothetical protein SK91_02252 [Klebsiella michiganensis]